MSSLKRKGEYMFDEILKRTAQQQPHGRTDSVTDDDNKASSPAPTGQFSTRSCNAMAENAGHVASCLGVVDTADGCEAEIRTGTKEDDEISSMQAHSKPVRPRVMSSLKRKGEYMFDEILKRRTAQRQPHGRTDSVTDDNNKASSLVPTGQFSTRSCNAMAENAGHVASCLGVVDTADGCEAEIRTGTKEDDEISSGQTTNASEIRLSVIATDKNYTEVSAAASTSRSISDASHSTSTDNATVRGSMGHPVASVRTAPPWVTSSAPPPTINPGELAEVGISAEAAEESLIASKAMVAQLEQEKNDRAYAEELGNHEMQLSREDAESARVAQELQAALDAEDEKRRADEIRAGHAMAQMLDQSPRGTRTKSRRQRRAPGDWAAARFGWEDGEH